MTASARDDDDTARPALRIGRWQLRGGRASAKQIRRTVHRALRGWGLGPAAGDLTDQLTALIQELLDRTANRARGPIHLRLELRASARLLLGEIHSLSSGRGHQPGGRGVVALTYGSRPTRDGNRYIHSFAWWQPDAVATDR